MAKSRRASVAPTPRTKSSSGPAAAAASSNPWATAMALAGLGGYSFPEQMVIIWFALDAWTHFVIEGLYLFFALQPGGAQKSSNPLAFIWREYGRADSRWMTYGNPDVLAVEFPTVFLMGPGALFCLYAALKRSAWKHVAIIVVSWCEIIGARTRRGSHPHRPPTFSNPPRLRLDRPM